MLFGVGQIVLVCKLIGFLVSRATFAVVVAVVVVVFCLCCLLFVVFCRGFCCSYVSRMISKSREKSQQVCI